MKYLLWLLIAIVTGSVDQSTATSNRTEIEAATSITLPAGEVELDRGLTIHSGQTIVGQAGTSIRNVYTSDGTYGRTIVTIGSGVSYFDSINVNGTDTTFTLADISQIGNYQVGAPIYLWHIDGFQDGTGQLRQLRRITAKDSGTGVVTVSGARLDSRLTAAKYYSRAQTLSPVLAGVTKIGTTLAPAVGSWVLLDEGPSIANEGRREWHRVIAKTAGAITLDSPVRRNYTNCVVAIVNPVNNVTLKNFTVSTPVNSGFETALIKYCSNWRFENMTFNGLFAPVSLCNCTFINCTFYKAQFNSCHGCRFIGCTFTNLLCEEACFDMDWCGCAFGPPVGGQAAIGANTACEKLSFHGGTISAPSGVAMGIAANDTMLDQVTVASGAAYLQGDRTRVTNSTGSIFLQIGVNCYVEHTPGIVLGLNGFNSSGVCFDSTGATVQAGNWSVQ